MVSPEILHEYFADSAEVLEQYAELLADQGQVRGLIGPREVPRLWERHILNCAQVAHPRFGLIAESSTVIDVGSGAGLPGLVWAIVRPDLNVTLIESMKRRTDFLEEAVDLLALQGRVRVLRARAEDVSKSESADVVTARAVSALPKLVNWLAPLVTPGGKILAMKGESAGQELLSAKAEIAQNRLSPGEVAEVQLDPSLDPTFVVSIRRPS